MTMIRPTAILTKNMATDKIISDHVIDHAHQNSRERMIRHIHWALNNNHGVQVEPLKKEE